MTSIKTNLIICLAMILSTRSLFSMLLPVVNIGSSKEATIIVINHHRDYIWLRFKQPGMPYEWSSPIQPNEKMTLEPHKRCPDLTCTAVMKGPSIINSIEFPLKKLFANQLIYFNFNDQKELDIFHDGKIIGNFKQSQNQKKSLL